MVAPNGDCSTLQNSMSWYQVFRNAGVFETTEKGGSSKTHMAHRVE